MEHAKAKPVLIWDGECWFCKLCVERIEDWCRDADGLRIETVPYQSALSNYPWLSQVDCENSVQFLIPKTGRDLASHTRVETDFERFQKSAAILRACSEASDNHERNSEEISFCSGAL
jgi:predicted DCC family thiol-disulfide oxidoreductase YuxK